MNKHTLKQCLNIIDRIEIQGLDSNQLQQTLHDVSKEQRLNLDKQKTDDLIAVLLQQRLIKQFHTICDLAVPLTIFARSPHRSTSETLGLMESLFTWPRVRDFFATHMEHSFATHQLESLFPYTPWLSEIILELNLMMPAGNRYRIMPQMQPLLFSLIRSDPHVELVFPVTIAYFIHDMLPLHQISFKNMHAPMVNYPQLDQILSAVPARGIPENRSVSEPLQSFFKDCLFHEFEHQCLLCQIDIPQLLIASHIKPFRDCGHLMESTDFHNGILLCRNHDYLFDQGYLAFDSTGALRVSHIAKQDYMRYQIPSPYFLPKELRTPLRSQFLAYHYHTYFKGK